MSPKLSKVPTGELEKKPETPEAIRKLLLPKTKMDFDNISFSGSEISDAFEDIAKDVYLSFENGKKPLSRHKTDRIIMANFTKDFKHAIEVTRKKLNLGPSMLHEDLDNINKILREKRKQKKLPKEVRQKIEELLKDEEYLCSTPSEKSEDGGSTRKSSSIGFDAMSGIWRMLAIGDTDERFETSPPGFNAFDQEKPHWLDRPNVPWETLDFSKQKCETWLKEQQDD